MEALTKYWDESEDNDNKGNKADEDHGIREKTTTEKIGDTTSQQGQTMVRMCRAAEIWELSRNQVFVHRNCLK